MTLCYIATNDDDCEVNSEPEKEPLRKMDLIDRWYVPGGDEACDGH
jgi:hypothetical protein